MRVPFAAVSFVAFVLSFTLLACGDDDLVVGGTRPPITVGSATPTPSCRDTGESCDSGTQCCSGQCDIFGECT